MKLKLEVLPIKKYKNYFVNLCNENNNLWVDWDSNSPYIRISNCKDVKFEVTVCHVENVDNLIEALKLLKTKFKK